MIEQDSATSAESHELIRVINPIACIRARLSNLSDLKRNPAIEVARIKAMMLRLLSTFYWRNLMQSPIPLMKRKGVQSVFVR